MLDGRSIPIFGLGVYMMTDDETYRACTWALEAGYRHVDTAEWCVACRRALEAQMREYP